MPSRRSSHSHSRSPSRSHYHHSSSRGYHSRHGSSFSHSSIGHSSIGHSSIGHSSGYRHRHRIYHYHLGSPGFYGAGFGVMAVSPEAARKMQTVGAVLLSAGAAVLVAGIVCFSRFLFGDMDHFDHEFGTLFAAMGLLFAGIPLTFVGLILVIIGSVRRSAPAGAAETVPTTISNPVPTAQAPVEPSQAADGPAPGEQGAEIPFPGPPGGDEGTRANVKFCPSCGIQNDGAAARCTNCDEPFA
ncbi:MAG: hypothetical protein JW839_18590 [Candidatus Lokiarchaeota archaeon]|nr:hypothetical protein [Candidatus Lokiarchaeota archaeon]